MLILRSGVGWKHVAGSVWEHVGGARVHMGGTVRTPGGQHFSLNNLCAGDLGRLLVRVNGGSRKRGLMAWAVNLAAAEGKHLL